MNENKRYIGYCKAVGRMKDCEARNAPKIPVLGHFYNAIAAPCAKENAAAKVLKPIQNLRDWQAARGRGAGKPYGVYPQME